MPCLPFNIGRRRPAGVETTQPAPGSTAPTAPVATPPRPRPPLEGPLAGLSSRPSATSLVGSGSLAGSLSPRGSLPSSRGSLPQGVSSPNLARASGSISVTQPTPSTTQACTSADAVTGAAQGRPARTHLTQNPKSALSESAASLVGVARWPDGRYNEEATEKQQEYGQMFSHASVNIGAQIASGQIGSVDQLWSQCRLWRATTADASDEKDASQFALSRENDTRHRSTSIEGRYGFLHNDVLIAANVAGGHTQETNPKDNAPYRVSTVQHQVELDGVSIPLTRMSVNSDLATLKPLAVLDPEPERGETLGTMLHTSPLHLPKLMARAEEVFQATLDAQTPQDKMDGLAELHWLLAHAMPDARGSAAKSEMAIRSMAHAMGMELPPCSLGSSPDLIAFVSSKEEFIEDYKDLFETPSEGVQREKEAKAKHEKEAAALWAQMGLGNPIDPNGPAAP